MSGENVQKDTFRPGGMKETSYAQQYRRQHTPDTEDLEGVKRFQYQYALLKEMPVLGGPNDQLNGNPQRYEPGKNV